MVVGVRSSSEEQRTLVTLIARVDDIRHGYVPAERSLIVTHELLNGDARISAEFPGKSFKLAGWRP